MAGLWNPSSPRVIGLEWLGHYTAADKATASPFRATRLRSTIAETIADMEVALAPNLNVAGEAFRILSVYNANNILLGDAFGIDRFVPNAHGTGTGIGNWTNQLGSAVNIYTSIDDAVRYPPIGTDYIRTQVGGASTAASFHMNSGAFPLTRRVGRLRVRFVASSSAKWRVIKFRLRHVPSGVDYVPSGADVNYHIYGILTTIDLGEINPVTLLPWTPVDVRGFGSAANVWQIRFFSAASPTQQARVHNAELEVQWATTEQRLAVGTWQRPPGAHIVAGAAAGFDHRNKYIRMDQWVQPDGAGNWVADWTKPGSGDFVFAWHGALDSLVGFYQAQTRDIFPALVGGATRDGAILPPVPGMASGPIVFGSASSRVQGAVFSAGPFDGPAVHGLAMIRSDTTTSDDSQPYYVYLANRVPETFDANETFDTYQILVAPVTDSYDGVRVVVKPPILDPGDLTITVHSIAGATPALTDAQVGGSLVVNARDLLLEPTVPGMPGYREIRGVLSSPAALTATNDYFIRFRKTSGRIGSSWGFVRIDSFGLAGANHDEATFQGGNAYAGRTNRSTGVDSGFDGSEIGVILTAAPDPPENADAVSQVLVISEEYSDDCGDGALAPCNPTFLRYAKVTWNSPGNYVDFDRWEIERLDKTRSQDPDVWVPVATSEDEGVSVFYDYESLRNRDAEWRIRARMLSGAFTDWAETGAVQLATEGDEVLFTSNVLPELSVGFNYDPQVSYTFPDHENDELVRFSGTTHQAAFVDVADRGVVGSYKLIVNGGDVIPVDSAAHQIGGETMFLPLRQMIRSNFDAAGLLPYIAVIDYEGNRRYAYVDLSNGERDQPFHRYFAQAAVTPLTEEPTVVELTAFDTGYLALDGAGDWVQSVDHADFDITGDITLFWEVAPDDFATIQTVGGKFTPTGDQRSYMAQHVATTGRPRLIWSTNGTVGGQVIATCGTTPAWPADRRLAFAASLDVNDGSGNWDCQFYVADRHGGPYAALGSIVTAVGTTSIFNSNAVYTIGAHGSGTEPFKGKIFHMSAWAGLITGFAAGGTRRSEMNFRVLLEGTPPLLDIEGAKPFTYQGNARIDTLEPDML